MLVDKPSISLVGHRCVIVTEASGSMTPYRTWSQFFKRADADELCQDWLKRNKELYQIVVNRMYGN